MTTDAILASRRGLMLRLAPWLACLAVLGLVVLATTQWRHWVSARAIQTTENAFVEADTAVLSARIGGHIQALPVDDYQAVRAGEVIARIDPADARWREKAARAALSKAQAHLDNLDNEIAEQRANVALAEANLRAAEVRIGQHRRNPARQAALVEQGALSRQHYESAQADLDHAVSMRDAARAQAALAARRIDVLEGGRAGRAAEREAAAAELDGARRDLAYTRITAPFDGVLGKRHVQRGSLVASGSQIVSIVPQHAAYVIANYTETQLARVQAGLPARVHVDGLPGVRLRGRVEEIAPMSGAKSALLPAENASGNFTKVVQRIPVRIAFEPGQPALQRLRPGMSVQVEIDTRAVPVDDEAVRPEARP